ncbi:hypothetical protein [Curtobacterium ammoniigenes]|uniref:hypothetical protein n=1 Tax=Curtobacterium ammoniigenes TaxID=395387 RepID=UPI0012ED63E1|nr:hypothetical protein [Curtobacterium ammoniigenes]
MTSSPNRPSARQRAPLPPAEPAACRQILPAMSGDGGVDVLGFTSERVSGEGVLLATAARMLNLTVLDVRNRIVDRDLWAPRLLGVRRVPWWQFVRRPVGVPGARYWFLPWLEHVIPALPGRAPAAVVNTFMTSPHVLLPVGGQGVTPTRWLVCGGAPNPVISILQDLDRQ